MATTLEALKWLEQPEFISAVKYYLLLAAVSVTTENAATAQHAARAALARAILYEPLRYATLFAAGVLTNSTIKAYADYAMIAEGDIQFVVNSIYNSYL